MPIPVYLNNQIANDLCTPSSCPSFTDIERTTKAVLGEYYYSSGGLLRFAYMGSTSTPPLQNVSNAIHIYAYPCSGGTLGIAAANGAASPAYGRIRICSSNDTGDLNWNSFKSDNSFHAVLLHELGHVVGMGHTQDCNNPAPANSIMNAFIGGTKHLKWVDLNFVNDYYGSRVDQISRRSSTDGLTWTEVDSSTPVHLVDPRGRIAASNTAGVGTGMISAFTAYGAFGSVEVYSRNTLWSYWGSVGSLSTYHPAVARSSSGAAWVSYLGQYDTTNHVQKVISRRTINSGLTWAAAVEVSNSSVGRTKNSGIASTYDSVSGKVIYLWRSSNDEILYKVGDGPTIYNLIDPSTSTPIRTTDTPSIACGASAVVGSDNCLIAWTNYESWSRTTHWTQGYVSGDSIVIPSSNAVKTHPYVTSGSASVAYAYGSASQTSYPWTIALSQGGTISYTWRKGGSYASNFVDQRSFSETPMPGLPFSAATGDGVRYAIVSDQ